MTKIKYYTTNRTRVFILITSLFILFFVSIAIPLIFIKYLTFSGVGHFFSDNISYGIVSTIVLIYFIIIGEYYYYIKIDPYIVQVTSYRPIIDMFKQKDYVDIPHNMLADYAFFDRPLSFNKTLMLKIKTESGREILKRFNLTIVRKKEIEKISYLFDQIIVKNK